MCPDIPIYPAQNTHFMGAEEREEGYLEERCGGCGQCLLGETGGVCPVVRCTKSLLNGACGGSKNGKCELSKDKDCGWVLIYERLQSLGRLGNLDGYQPPKNNARWSRLRSLDVAPTVATFHSLAGQHTVSQED